MDKLQILHYKFSLKQRLLKLKRIPSPYLWLILCMVIIAGILLNQQEWTKNQYARITLAVIAVAEQPLKLWRNFYYSIATPSQIVQQKIKDAEYINQILQRKLCEISQENSLLKKTLHYHDHNFKDFVSTPVLGAGLSNRFRYIFASVGSSHGIKLRQTVLNRGLIIGSIDQVTTQTCRILMSTNHLSHIPIYVGSPHQQGIAYGCDNNLLQLKLTGQDHDIKPGDAVFTSGLGGTYPAHKIIGCISSVSSHHITVIPATLTASTDVIQIIVPLTSQDELRS